MNGCVVKQWYCYSLVSEINENRTYVGATINFDNRLKSHNGLKSGGAKYTRRYRPWKFYLQVSGFENKRLCLSFEKHWKKQSQRMKNRCLSSKEKRFESLLYLIKKFKLKYGELSYTVFE